MSCGYLTGNTNWEPRFRAACLADKEYHAFWSHIGTSDKVLKWLSEGVRMPFKEYPHGFFI